MTMNKLFIVMIAALIVLMVAIVCSAFVMVATVHGATLQENPAVVTLPRDLSRMSEADQLAWKDLCRKTSVVLLTIDEAVRDTSIKDNGKRVTLPSNFGDLARVDQEAFRRTVADINIIIESIHEALNRSGYTIAESPKHVVIPGVSIEMSALTVMVWKEQVVKFNRAFDFVYEAIRGI